MTEDLNILLLENSKMDAELVKHALMRAEFNCKVRHAVNKSEFTTMIKDSTPDIVLADFYLDGFTGLEALAIAREVHPDVPFIVLTGTINEQIAMDCLNAGVDDYVTKEHLIRLSPSIRVTIAQRNAAKAKKQVEETLHYREEYYRSLIESVTDVIAVVNEQGVLRFISPAAHRLLGYEAGTLQDRDLAELLHDEDINKCRKYVLSTLDLSEGRANSVELRLRKRSGGHVATDCVAKRLRIQGLEEKQAVVVFRDITDRKEFEQSLIEAKNKAEEMDQLKTHMLANLSHEIRTPMNAILGFSSILKNDLQGHDGHEFADLINTSANRLMLTLDNIITLAQLESGDINRSDLEPVELSSELFELFSLFESRITDAGLVSIMDIENNQQLFSRINSTLFRKIVESLLDNAVKFTKEGSVKLSLKEKQGSAIVSVSDTGIGISEEFLPQLFTPFTQESAGRNRNYEGTGLGLALTQLAVEQMGGSISVSTSKNYGSTFTVTFPLDKSVVTTTSASGTTEEAVLEEVQSDVAVLAVEDDGVNQFLLQEYLSEYCDITVAGSAEEAIEACKKTQFELILQDINLGTSRFDGIEVMKTVREMEQYREVPIVAATAYASDKDRQVFLSEGFSDYVAKPYTKEQLLSVLKKFFLERLATKM